MKKHIISFFVFVVSLFVSSSVLAQQEFWVSTRDDVFIRPEYENYGPSIALLRFGDIVRVTRCIPNCNDRSSWVELYPFGATRISYLSPITTRTQEAAYLSSGPQNFIWAKITSRRGITVNGEHFGHGDELFFVGETTNSFVRANGLEIPKTAAQKFVPSTFSGWVNPPQGNFAFVIRDSMIVTPSGRREEIRRYNRFTITNIERNSGHIFVGNGYIEDRNSIRVGTKHARPNEIPSNAQWVHVDLEQQILTAYSNDNSLVFATLVSTGSSRHPTRRGIFQVRRKISYTQMRGGGTHPYSVEGVPWVMYFDDAIALHGAFWHDQFGTRRSHGCVNLSVRDAKWLYDFASITIPQGWRSIHPIQTLDPSDNLWVVVE